VLNAVYKGKDIHSTWLWLLTKGETGYRWINLSCGLSRDECDDEEALKLTMKEMKCLGVLVTE
jgi:hypothetical protein